MADATNQNSGGTIDLRTGKTGGSAASTTQNTSVATNARATSSSGNSGTPAAGQNFDDKASKFDIPDTVKEQYAELIPLIIATESMNDDERQYWFQILPIMTDEQVGKLREILANEKKQLTDLDKQYKEELNTINTKHASEWKAFEAKEKREKIKKAETSARTKEETAQEDLLKKLQDI